MSYLKRFGKLHIGAANTEKAVINFLPQHMQSWRGVDLVACYIEELRTQAKWDAEKNETVR